MLAIVPSAVLHGVEGRPVRVEVHVSSGLPGFTVVGLPDTACRESRDRVRAALLSSSLAWPLRRVTVNLAPSGVRKQGAGLDLAIAFGLLAAGGELPPDGVGARGFIGELGLDGTVRPVAGAVALADAVDAAEVVVAAGCAAEAALVGRTVRPVRTLADVVAALRGDAPWPAPADRVHAASSSLGPDLADVRGQRVARLALELAAAGGHHLLFVGPPGAGKTMLARRLPGLLPPLDDAEALEVTKIHSAAGLPLPAGDLVRRPPYRAPHHTSSSHWTDAVPSTRTPSGPTRSTEPTRSRALSYTSPFQRWKASTRGMHAIGPSSAFPWADTGRSTSRSVTRTFSDRRCPSRATSMSTTRTPYFRKTQPLKRRTAQTSK